MFGCVLLFMKLLGLPNYRKCVMKRILTWRPDLYHLPYLHFIFSRLEIALTWT